MKTILFSLPGNEELTELMATKIDAEVGKTTLRKFPDADDAAFYCMRFGNPKTSFNESRQGSILLVCISIKKTEFLKQLGNGFLPFNYF